MKKINFNKIFCLSLFLLHFFVLIVTFWNLFYPNKEWVFILQVSLTVSLIQTLLMFLIYLSYKLLLKRKVILQKANSYKWYKNSKPEELKSMLKIVLPSFLIIQGETASIMNEVVRDTFFAAVYSFVIVSFFIMCLLFLIIAIISINDLKINCVTKRIFKMMLRLKNGSLSFFKGLKVKIADALIIKIYNESIDIFMENYRNDDLLIINQIYTEKLNDLKKTLEFRGF
ncbi:hypothetical protein [Spiroplasma endosymbiont of Panorpa germanica]|uniref:hypothetical protein n=1 Tax=Spiroplasma endosymbiont of Panorpa germanica TaxID=3066314 RepID=UPI0030CF2D2A